MTSSSFPDLTLTGRELGRTLFGSVKEARDKGGNKVAIKVSSHPSPPSIAHVVQKSIFFSSRRTPRLPSHSAPHSIENASRVLLARDSFGHTPSLPSLPRPSSLDGSVAPPFFRDVVSPALLALKFPLPTA